MSNNWRRLRKNWPGYFDALLRESDGHDFLLSSGVFYSRQRGENAALCRRSSYSALGFHRVQLGGLVNGSPDPAKDASERLKAAIEELGGIQSLLVSGELDSRILTDLRDAVNRVRNTAWAAYQYAESKITGKDSRNIMSIVASERIRAAYQLCQAIQADLETTDVHLQAGQLIQLYAATKSLTDKLDNMVRELK